MDITRGCDCTEHIQSKKSLLQGTIFVAEENDHKVAILEYDFKAMDEIELIHFKVLEQGNREELFNFFMKELLYWHPYISKIIAGQNFKSNLLTKIGFEFNDGCWLYLVNNKVEPFKLKISEIRPEQLTVEKTKVERVGRWIKTPEDIVICCIKINKEYVCIDGYSRLLAALEKGFTYVYGFIDPVDDISFYKECLSWCEEEGVYTIQDLKSRVVSKAEHKRLWINRCQAYLNK